MSTAARAKDLLSHFATLAPVGDPISVRRLEVLAALKLDHNSYNCCLNHLIAGGFVRRAAAKVLVVLRNPEDFK